MNEVSIIGVDLAKQRRKKCLEDDHIASEKPGYEPNPDLPTSRLSVSVKIRA